MKNFKFIPRKFLQFGLLRFCRIFCLARSRPILVRSSVLICSLIKAKNRHLFLFFDVTQNFRAYSIEKLFLALSLIVGASCGLRWRCSSTFTMLFRSLVNRNWAFSRYRSEIGFLLVRKLVQLPAACDSFGKFSS